MNRKFILALSLFAFMAASAASAHDLWVNASVKDGVLDAAIGYGHDFPNPEPIPEERLQLFAPMQLVTEKGAADLKQEGENYAYKGKLNAEKGSFLVLATYKPTFWSKGPEGWKMADRPQYKELTQTDATYSEEVAMYAKNVLNVGGASDAEVVTKPVGQQLEFVPQVNPATVKPGQRFPVQVLQDGKPVKTAEVQAVFAGFAGETKEGDPANEYKAFCGRTDLNGIVNIIPLKAGYWVAVVKTVAPYADKAKADELVLYSYLTFTISE